MTGLDRDGHDRNGPDGRNHDCQAFGSCNECSRMECISVHECSSVIELQITLQITLQIRETESGCAKSYDMIYLSYELYFSYDNHHFHMKYLLF